MKSIESQLGSRVSDVFADISAQPVAAASLGQVYKGIIIVCCTWKSDYKIQKVHKVCVLI